MKRWAWTLLLCVPFVVPEHSHAAVRPRLAPPVPCTMANRIDVFIDEDNILWECTCVVVWSGFTCHWQVVAGVDAPTIRRLIKRHKRFVLRPVAVVS